MRYGLPPIRERIKTLARQGCDRILIVPLYPQYSAATTATAYDSCFPRADPDALAAGRARRSALLRRPGLYRGAGRLDRPRPCRTRLEAGNDPRLLPWPARGLSAEGRSLSLPLPEDDPPPCARQRGLGPTSASASPSSRDSAAPSGSSPIRPKPSPSLPAAGPTQSGGRSARALRPTASRRWRKSPSRVREIFQANGGENFSMAAVPQRQPRV